MDRTTRAALRSFPRAMWIIAAGNFIHRFGGFVIPMLALYLTKLGQSEGRIGLVLGAYGVGKLVSAVAGGSATDAFGHRAVIAASMFSSAVVMLVMSQLESFAALFAATAVLGFCSELFRPATSALIAELASPENRITAFALNRLAINAGFAFGPALAGLLAERSFFWIFAGNAAAAIAYGAIVCVSLPARIGATSTVPTPDVSDATGRAEGWSAVLRDRRLLLFLVAILPVAMIYMQPSGSLALYVHDIGISAADYGLLLSLNGVLIVVGELSLTGVTRRMRSDVVLVVGYLLLGGGFAATGLCTGFWPLALTVFVWTLGEMVSAPAQGAVLANQAPDHLRGRYMGAYSLMWSIAAIAGPSLGTFAYAHGRCPLWWGSLAAGVASAALVWLALRRSTPR
jgi:MFS family permease